MTSTPLAAMQAAQAAAVEQKRGAVEQALADAIAEGAHVTVRGIAKRAGVSRQFLYNHRDLKEAIEGAARAPRPNPARLASSDAVATGLRAERRTLTAKIERQRATIAGLRADVDDLETQRRRWLGSQLNNQETISPEEHAELRLALDKLMVDNRDLARRANELQRLNHILEDDLSASRKAHAEDIARFVTDDGGTVTSISHSNGAP